MSTSKISDINMVTLSGRLVDDGKLQETSNGTSYLSFTVASNRYYTDRDGNEQKRTEFVDVVQWGPQAVRIAGEATRGKPCYIIGEANVDDIETKEGQKRRVFRVRAKNVSFVSM